MRAALLQTDDKGKVTSSSGCSAYDLLALSLPLRSGCSKSNGRERKRGDEILELHVGSGGAGIDLEGGERSDWK